MAEFIAWFQANWVGIIAVLLAFHKILVSIRDIMDKTPATDDNWFEKMVTMIGKLLGYLATGKRPV
jgi:hypothetical protein